MSEHEVGGSYSKGPKRTVRVIDVQDAIDTDDELQDILNKGLMVIPEDEFHKFSKGLYSAP